MKQISNKEYEKYQQYVSNSFGKLLREKGLRHIRLHDLRHSCASLRSKTASP